MGRIEIEKKASSKTINKSIHELNALLKNGQLPQANGRLRRKYQEKLQEVLEEIALDWYHLGFERCHKVLFKAEATKRTKVRKRMTMRSGYFASPISTTLSSKIMRTGR